MAAPDPPMAGNPTGDFDFDFDFATLAEPLRTQAINRFRLVIDHFQPRKSRRRNNKNYNRPALIRYTFEYARSSESQNRFLSAFFHRLRLGMADGDDITLDDDLRSRLFAFAEDLMNNFFIPLRAAGGQPTPQLTPLSHDAIQQAQTKEERDKIKAFTGTSRRLAALRSICLVRDRHRCAITRAFDLNEGNRRAEKRRPQDDDDQGDDRDDDRDDNRDDDRDDDQDDDRDDDPPRDDDGNILYPLGEYEDLEVAHILPHSLTKQKKGQLDNKRGVLGILNMFDIDIVDQIDGADIDQPHNALTLSQGMHSRFGDFKVVFQRIPGTDPHTYHIKTFLPLGLKQLPVNRTLLTHPTISAPSERLLALHCAIGHILHLSAAAEYIDRFLDDMDDGMVQADGSTPLDAMVRVALEMKG